MLKTLPTTTKSNNRDPILVVVLSSLSSQIQTLVVCQPCFLAVIDVAFPLLIQGKTKGGTQMANTDEDQPEVLQEILKMQQETHKLIKQMAQDVRRLKNELGLRDVMR